MGPVGRGAALPNPSARGPAGSRQSGRGSTGPSPLCPEPLAHSGWSVSLALTYPRHTECEGGTALPSLRTAARRRDTATSQPHDSGLPRHRPPVLFQLHWPLLSRLPLPLHLTS